MNGNPHDRGPGDASALAERLGSAAVPLATTDPDASPDDLAALRGEFEDATVIGMGEASHGTREFTLVRRRLVRYLVEELGVRALAVEANFSAWMPVTEYVLGGDGDVEDLFATRQINWPYRTRGVVELVEWLRAFNQGRDPDDRVSWYGVDADDLSAPAVPVRSYLDRVDALDGLDEDLSWLVAVAAGEADPSAVTREDLRETAARLVPDLRARFEDRSDAFVGATSETAFQRARGHVEALSRTLDVFDGDEDLGRDEAMADTVDWILDHDPADRIVVWGHNAHVERGSLGVPDPEAGASMGEHLARRYGDGYYALGTEFGRGSVRVISREGRETFDYATGAFDAPPAGSVPAVLDAVDRSPLFVSVDRATEDPEVADWLRDEPRRHAVLASMDGDRPTYVASNLAEDFDGLVFVGNSTPTEPVGELFPGLT